MAGSTSSYWNSYEKMGLLSRVGVWAEIKSREKKPIAYVSEYDTSFFVNFGLVIVINLESGKQNLVLICGQ